jgi:DNA-binding response OmpR family regulator
MDKSVVTVKGQVAIPAKLRSVLRRTGAEGSPPPPVLRAGVLELDLEHRTLRKVGRVIHL